MVIYVASISFQGIAMVCKAFQDACRQRGASDRRSGEATLAGSRRGTLALRPIVMIFRTLLALVAHAHLRDADATISYSVAADGRETQLVKRGGQSDINTDNTLRRSSLHLKI